MSKNISDPDKQFGIDPYKMNILSKKFDIVTREMTQSLLRSARSKVISAAKDFSNAITLGDGRQFMFTEGIPVHVGNVNYIPEYTLDHYDDISPGDCFLTNSPYAGNTHAGDYTYHAPVFYEGELLFWAVNRGHQPDVGHPESGYMASAEDVFQEGPHLPSMRIRENYEEREDIVRFLEQNIRNGEEVWYSDYLAQLASVRTAEEELKNICDEYGVETVKNFTEAWLDYGEQMMRQEIQELPEKQIEHTCWHDPIPLNDAAPDGFPINVKIDIDHDKDKIIVDIRDNPPQLKCGLNTSKATTTSSVIGGILSVVDEMVPPNHGALSRIEIKRDKGKVVGEPEFPAPTASATINIAALLHGTVQTAFAKLGEPFGFAEGNTGGQSLPWTVIRGTDFRTEKDFVDQIFLTGGGGPGHHGHDGWMTYGTPGVGGVMFRSSIEIEEQEFPILVKRSELLKDTAGAGKSRGAPASITEITPRERTLIFGHYCQGIEHPPKGVLGGKEGSPQVMYKITDSGEKVDIPGISDNTVVTPEETIIGTHAGGGGYGDPFERDTNMVLKDVMEEYVSIEKAREDYGVVIEEVDGELIVNEKRSMEIRDSEQKVTEP